MAVMYLGRIVEEGETDRVISSPLHPYTQRLIASVPIADPGARRLPVAARGEPPSTIGAIAGCAFASRCPEVTEICRQTTPPLESKRRGHFTACHFDSVAGRRWYNSCFER